MNEALLIIWLSITNIFYSAPPDTVRFSSAFELDAAKTFGRLSCEPLLIDKFGYSGACVLELNDCIKYDYKFLKKVYIHELAHYQNYIRNGLKTLENGGHGTLWEQIMADWDQKVEATTEVANWSCMVDFSRAEQRIKQYNGK